MADIRIEVKTVKSDRESTDWSLHAREHCQWGALGHILERSDSHGLVYKVQHLDGTEAWYEPRELTLVSMPRQAHLTDISNG